MSTITVAVAQSIAMPGDVARSVQSQLVPFPELSLTGYACSLTPADALALSDPRPS